MAIRRPRAANAPRSSPMQGGPGGNSQKPGLSLPLNKAFGQHLLKNTGILDKIIEAAEIRSSDTVLEIGPGTGNVTMRLLSAAKQVVALEIDPRMAAEVKKRALTAGRMNLRVIEGDAIKTTFPAFDVCVANLPYQISSPFVFKLLGSGNFRCAVVMFQKEFAERLVAQVGEEHYGRLAVNTQLRCKVTRVCKVAKGSFNPPPEVDSMVVKFTPHRIFDSVDLGEFDGLLRICFNRKNRTLNAGFNNKHVIGILENNFKTLAAMRGSASQVSDFKALVLDTLRASGLAETRAAKIDINGFLRLLLAFNQVGIHFTNVDESTPLGEAMETDD